MGTLGLFFNAYGSATKTDSYPVSNKFDTCIRNEVSAGHGIVDPHSLSTMHTIELDRKLDRLVTYLLT